MNNDTTIIAVGLADLYPSSLNPRKHFDAAAITQLAESLRSKGQITPIIVRPEWCDGLTTKADLEEMRKKEAGKQPVRYQIISGECRYRAAKEATLDTLNAIVTPLTDPELVEINLTEQLQRNELTALEEAEGFSLLLSYKNEDGTPRHTADSIAKSISKTKRYVYLQLSLLTLPKAAKKTLSEGKLAPSQAQLIARIPDEKQQAEATKQALNGGYNGAAMTYLELSEWIEEHCMRSLANAPFDGEDTSLVKHRPELSPHAACSVCPFRTGFNKEKFGDVKRGDVCTRPACWQAKAEATYELAAERAKMEGKKLLSDAESARIYPPYQNVGSMAYDSAYVDLDTKPAEHLLKPEVKRAPKFRELVELAGEKDMKVEIVVAKDQNGKLHELALREVVIAAADKCGEPIFRGKNERHPKQDSDFAKRQREEKNKAAQQLAVTLAALEALYQALLDKWILYPVWDALEQTMIGHGGHEAAWLVCKWKGLKSDPKAPQLHTDLVEAHLKTLKPVERQVVVCLLLIGTDMRWRGIGGDDAKALAAFAKVDLKEIEKTALAAHKAAKAKKDKPAKKPAAKAKAKPETNRPKKKDAGGKAVAAVKSSMKRGGKGGAS